MATVTVVEKGSGFVLQLDPYEMLHDLMTGEQREQLIESLSCHEEIIGHVCEQLITGFTNSCYSGSWSTAYDTALQRAKKMIAENSGHAVEKTISDMTQQIESLKKDVKYYRDNYVRINREL